ncbi:MAG: dihydropteroate synthase [Planctomycetes bacterium]|nr:dihydropteroate synthase [Planctomycetota bacterium]
MAGRMDHVIGESGGFELELPRGGSWKLGSRPALMGILNCTPDSFSDGGQYAGSEAAVNAACGMVEDGADIVDVGGESTRPGADPVSSDEQLDRVIPVIRGLRRRSDVLVSIDTRDPRVGRAALEAGADIVNDVSACDDPGWVPVLTEHRCPVILMHMRGTPASMQENTNYPAGVLNEICGFLEDRIELLAAGGIVRERMIVDPGIGFSKEAGQNMEILAGLRQLRGLGRPILFGASRKFFLGSILGDASGRGRDPLERDVATVAANMAAVQQGASILRVHNVPYTRDLLDVAEALRLAAEQGLALDALQGSGEGGA